MDDIVKQAMTKWPNVPHCFGWLGLDERGHWYLRDDQAQACGRFQSGLPGSKGSLLQHDKLIEFIHRNYAVDAKGAWYFQNGPQRVYVELAATPFVWFTDQTGRVYFQTDLGFGLLHTLDVAMAAEGLENHLWPLETIDCFDMPSQFGFTLSPQEDNKKPL
jgi:hypothetical protein